MDTENPTSGHTIGDTDRLNDSHKTMQAAISIDGEWFLREFMTRISVLAAGKR